MRLTRSIELEVFKHLQQWSFIYSNVIVPISPKGYSEFDFALFKESLHIRYPLSEIVRNFGFIDFDDFNYIFNECCIFLARERQIIVIPSILSVITG